MLDNLIREARGWLADCGLRVPPQGLDVALKVDREYDGGWPAFVRSDPDADESAAYLSVKERWPYALDILYTLPDPTPTGDPGLILG